MTTVTASGVGRTEARSRTNEIWRVVRLHAVNPSVFFGIPWLILGGAWAVSVVLVLIMTAAGSGAVAEGFAGMRYSWAVLSPQWYLVAVGVQAVAMTFNFALGFGATRRDFWLGTGVMFLIVSLLNAIAIATLVQLEIATGGWWIGAHMFDALWYGQQGWIADAFTTFSLQLSVLFVGAAVTTVFMRWRMRGMMVLLFGSILAFVGFIALVTFTDGWIAVFTALSGLSVVGFFAWLLVVTLVFALGGYLVIRRATPR